MMKKLLLFFFLATGYLTGFSQIPTRTDVIKIINDSMRTNGANAITANTINAVMKAINSRTTDSLTVVQMITTSGGANNYVTGVSFTTATGILMIQRSGLSALNISLDGRYLKFSDTAAMLTAYQNAINTLTTNLNNLTARHVADSIAKNTAIAGKVSNSGTISINGTSQTFGSNPSFTIAAGTGGSTKTSGDSVYRGTTGTQFKIADSTFFAQKKNSTDSIGPTGYETNYGTDSLRLRLAAQRYNDSVSNVSLLAGKASAASVALMLDSNSVKARIRDSIFSKANLSAVTPKIDSVRVNTLLSAITPKLNDVYIDLAKAYGIVADGITDNTTALMRLQSDLSGYGKPHYILLSQQGTILYTNNRWQYNIVNFDIWGAGSGTIFRNIYSGTDEKFQRPFYNGDMFQNNTMAYTGTVTYATSHKFNQAVAGSRTLTCITASDAANYAAGNRVLLWGYDQTGAGYPPGTRYHEWHEIESVNTTTGVITLKKALKYTWNPSWWDVPNLLETGKNSGKPRILLLDRADYIYPKHIGYHNLTFGTPFTGATGASGTCGPIAENIIVEDCIVEGNFWPTEVAYMKCERVKVIGNPATFVAEVDKMSGTLILEDCYFRNPLSNGTGFENIYINNCQFDESTFLCPRNLSIKNSILRSGSYPDIYRAPLSAAPAQNPIRQLTIENLTFTKSSASSADNALDLLSLKSLTVSAVSGNNIVVPFGTWTDASAQLVYTIEAGYTRIFKTDGSKAGLVTSVSFDSSYNSNQGAFVISGNWNVAPVAAEVWKWSTVAQVVDLGGHKNVGNFTPISGEQGLFRISSNKTAKIHTTILSTKNWAVNGGDKDVLLSGKILDVEAVVNKVYNGTDGACNIFILVGSGYSDLLTLNCKIAGRRTINEFTTAGAKSGDNLTTTSLDTWLTDLHFFMRGSSGNLSDQSEPALPEVEITIRWMEN